MAKTASMLAGNQSETVYDWTYKARNPETLKIITGKAKAPNRQTVIGELSRRELIPLKVSGGPNAGLGTEIAVRKTAKHRSLVITTRLMATMYDAGLSPLESLDVAIKDCEDQVLKDALTEVRIQIQQGIPLSTAMASQKAFPSTVINFIKAGETSGDVKDALNRVANQFDAEDKLRAKVRKAMMYPLVVAIISGLIFTALMLFLVPAFAESFAEIGGPDAQLPLITRMVVGVSAVLPYILGAIIPTWLIAWFWYKSHKSDMKVREIVEPLKLKLPIFGNLFHKIALASFARNLSGLLDAGVERLEALEITSETIGHVSMERAVLEARDAQREGASLVTPLKAEPLFPNMVIQMVEVGERSGSTGAMLGKAADIYDSDIDVITDNLSALIEPLFLVVLGAMISVIVIAIYLPYLSIGAMV